MINRTFLFADRSGLGIHGLASRNPLSNFLNVALDALTSFGVATRLRKATVCANQERGDHQKKELPVSANSRWLERHERSGLPGLPRI